MDLIWLLFFFSFGFFLVNVLLRFYGMGFDWSYLALKGLVNSIAVELWVILYALGSRKRFEVLSYMYGVKFY